MQLPYGLSLRQAGGPPRTNIRRYIGIAGPQMGLVNGYTGLEGQDIHLEGYLGSPFAGLVRLHADILARREGYCVWLVNFCHVRAKDAYAFTHNPIHGTSIITEFLPTATFGDYLTRYETPHDPFPYGRTANPLLEASSVVDGISVIDPYMDNAFVEEYLAERLDEWFNDRFQERHAGLLDYETPYHGLNEQSKLAEWQTTLDNSLAKNVCFIHNDEQETKIGLRVTDPNKGGFWSWLGSAAPYWRNGRHKPFDNEVGEEQEFLNGPGDKLIATISANPLTLPWPENDKPVDVSIAGTEHGPIVGVPNSIQSITSGFA